MNIPTMAMTPERFRALFYKLSSDFQHAVLLDSCGLESETAGLYVMAFGAESVLQFVNGQLRLDDAVVLENPSPNALWAKISEIFEQQKDLSLTERDSSLPFKTGWLGVLAYELNHWVEATVPARQSETPLGLLTFIRPSHVVTWSAITDEFVVLSSDLTWRETFNEALGGISDSVELDSVFKVTEFIETSSPELFSEQVERVLAHIRAGDIYQANLSMRFSVSALSRPAVISLYDTLVTTNPSPFSGLFITPEGSILCNSPERLVSYSPLDNTLDTRPIAGTRGRGKSEREDTEIGQSLHDNLKEHAEHLMLLDLMRNDLGRIAEPASVTVPKAFYLERYSHVTHLVSQVTAQKASNKSAWDVLRAVFPGGTITGCPKVRCMEILNDVETVPRGYYTGSLGYIDFSGAMDWNILIRSLYNYPSLDRLDFHAGAGIVADSVASWEYKECQRKIQAILSALIQVENQQAVGVS